MNVHAKKMHLVDTFYDSPHGLRNRLNISTAYDVALMTRECMKKPLFRRVVGTQIMETKSIINQAFLVRASNDPTRKANQYTWVQTNKLLGQFDGLIGCKTGFTPVAGPCFSGYYKSEGLELALVLLNSRTQDIRWSEIRSMVAYVKAAV